MSSYTALLHRIFMIIIKNMSQRACAASEGKKSAHSPEYLATILLKEEFFELPLPLRGGGGTFEVVRQQQILRMRSLQSLAKLRVIVDIAATPFAHGIERAWLRKTGQKRTGPSGDATSATYHASMSTM